MRKILFFVAFLPLVTLAQHKTNSFTLSGRVKHLAYTPEWVFLQYRTNGEWKTDSVMVKDKEYKFKGQVSEPAAGRIRVKYLAGADGKKMATAFARDMATVFLMPGKIKVSSVDSFSNISVKGSAAHDEYTALNKQTKPYEERMKPLYDQYAAFTKAKNKEGEDKLEKQIDEIDNEKKEKVYREYVKANPNSPLAIYALQQYTGWDINPDIVEPLFNTLSENNKSYPSALNLKEDIETAKKTGIGKIAMDFTQNDTLDAALSLTSLRGRYVLVDFWASWCGPCRAENPNVVKVYNKFKDQNFHILGVSLDRPGQKDKWMKAIHDDQLEWTHVSDLKFWDNAVARQYGIKAIPQNLLLDPQGKIIAKNLKGEGLEQKLNELMGEKKGF